MMRHIILLCIILAPYTASASHDTLSSAMAISAAGMKVQNQRLKVVAENIANADIAPPNAKTEPYRRKIASVVDRYNDKEDVNLVVMEKAITDKSDFILKYEPQHPAADKNGIVRYPNVNLIMENADARGAQRNFEANLHALEITRANQNRLLEALK